MFVSVNLKLSHPVIYCEVEDLKFSPWACEVQYLGSLSANLITQNTFLFLVWIHHVLLQLWKIIGMLIITILVTKLAQNSIHLKGQIDKYLEDLGLAKKSNESLCPEAKHHWLPHNREQIIMTVAFIYCLWLPRNI